MGQVHIDEVTLADVVQSSSLIVVASPVSSTEVREPIDDETWDGEEAPPFVWRKRRFAVEEVLLGDANLQGVELDVQPADLEWDRDLHRRYYVDGASMSPMKEVYYGPDLGEDRRILFLAEDNYRIRFTCTGAEEAAERLDEVRAAVANRAPDVVVVERPGRSLWPPILVVVIVVVLIALLL